MMTEDIRELQCVAVCCSVLQCVAVRCSVLQCVAVCCSESSVCYSVYSPRLLQIPPTQFAFQISTGNYDSADFLIFFCGEILPGGRDTVICHVLSSMFSKSCASIHADHEPTTCVEVRVAVCCSVLQCVAVFCSVLNQCSPSRAPQSLPTTNPRPVLQCVLQCVAMCCNVLQCVAVC